MGRALGVPEAHFEFVFVLVILHKGVLVSGSFVCLFLLNRFLINNFEFSALNCCLSMYEIIIKYIQFEKLRAMKLGGNLGIDYV